MRSRRLLIALALAVVLAGTRLAVLSAHDYFHFVGRITDTTETRENISLTFTEKGEDVTVRLWVPSDTPITRDDEPLARSELAVGLHVVVDATGDNYDGLEALEIQVVPAPERSPASASIVPISR